MQATIEAVFRAEYARVFAILTRTMPDFEAAEDALQQAFVRALATWPTEGVPQKPAAWLTTVARNEAISAARKRTVATRASDTVQLLALEAWSPTPDDDIPDHRLRLIFACCHPALSDEARIALALQTLCGLQASAIARLFLVPEGAIAQRLVRAKRKIRENGIALQMPTDAHIEERIDAVLRVVYLLFTEGYAPTDGVPPGEALCLEALHLGRLLCHLLPTDASVQSLYALMLFHHARFATRTTPTGDLIPLDEQPRDQWNHAAIAEASHQLEQALARKAFGKYQIEAAIAALHATAATAADTDWQQIAALYRVLYRIQPSSTVALNMAVAIGMADGPWSGISQIDHLQREGRLEDSPLIHAARADLLRRSGNLQDAESAYLRAIETARNSRELRYFERRREECRVALG